MGKMIKAALWVVFLTLILLGVPRVAGMIASLFDYQVIDPDGSYAWISVHHIVQALIIIIVIVLLNLYKPLKYGFGCGNKVIGRRYVLIFTLVFSAGSLVSHLIMYLTGSLQQFAYPLTATNITGYLSFQLLLSGPSEELIFRAFAITMLALVVKKRILNGKASLANIFAALIFGVAHVGFSFAPFSINFSLLQVILAVVLGFFYGDCYEKTRSIYYPMMMHSISNVVMVGLSILATWIL
ncbi:MAG: CPBP family intramembrane glutamic endopeptidase [Bacillota bacterium]|nr:CPBP family intramembrane glutamic endopeptidase [Bacillota bacterium]